MNCKIKQNIGLNLRSTLTLDRINNMIQTASTVVRYILRICYQDKYKVYVRIYDHVSSSCFLYFEL